VKPLDPRLLRYSAAARGYLAVTVVLGLVATGLILIQASLLARLLAGAATGTGLTVLAGALVALVGVLVARAAASYGGEVTALRAAAAVKSQLRRRLVDHALRLGPSWLAETKGRHRAGEVTTLATRGLDGLDAYFARYLPQLVLACLVPFAVLIRVAFADWISAVVIGVTLPLIPVFAILVGLHTKATTQRQWRLLARLGGHFLDVVEGLPTLKLFGRGKPQAEVIGTVTEEYRAVTMSTLRVAFLSGFVLELAAALATALVAVEVGLRLLAGHMSYQTALLVLLLTPEAYLPLRAVGAQFHASTEGAAAARDVFEILDTPALNTFLTTPAPAVPGRRVSLHTDTIILSGVSLAYPGRDHRALAGVNLTIRPGDRITLAGPSGAGKSSLLAVLLRFAEPTGGRIEAGGVDLTSIPVADWRRQISWIPQQPYLFTASVADNIALGQADATPQAIARAAQAAGAAEFIEQLPAGYATEVGERGLRLSSGQRQQIALARAFLRDAPLLLLDEPTAHLDAVSAHRLEEAIATLMADRTVIQVTHSQNQTRDIGRLLTLDHGALHQASSPCPAPPPALLTATP